MSLPAGSRLGSYEIVAPLGRGGMGEVYRARHQKLGREVAIKVLPEELSADRQRLIRFEREARLASSLNHPSIVTIYDIAEHQGTTFIAMELVDGQTLRELLAGGPLPLDRAIHVATQIADGLAKAHAAGVVHRDLKPENIMVTADGLVKILDFGLARPLSVPEETVSAVSTFAQATAEGAIVGTPRYMSPEQLGGGMVDHRSDQFAFGIVVYEMLTGKLPFDGPTLPSLISAIVHDPAPPLKRVRRDAPADLAKITERCLGKEPNDRYESFAEISEQLRKVERRRAGVVISPGALLRRPAVAVSLALIILIAGLGLWLWFRGSGQRWAETEALPQIAEHIETGDLYEAYRLVLNARRYLPENAELEKTFQRITLPLKVVTNPSGAEVSVKGYATPEAPWELLGTTPLEMRVPYAMMRWRIWKEGFETFEGAPFGGPPFMTFATGLKLDRAGTRPAGMVQIPAGGSVGESLWLDYWLDLPERVSAIPVDTFWLDRYEVTNRQFKEFVEAGGYSDREYWIEPFRDEGTELTWEEAIAALRDQTGRPGPSTWSFGTYPEGDDDLPVAGVSWHEAAAYCRYIGKSLPTVYHWFAAGGQEQLSDILRLSNFSMEGPAAIGSYKGLGGYGTSDMAGNVKEWCWNATGAGERYILGGAWNDPPYMYRATVARRPFVRQPTNGFRCARYPAPPDQLLLDPVNPRTEIPKPGPVSDEVFEVYLGLYEYERSELEAEVDQVDESAPYWRKETVSFKTAYGDERMQALLFLPRNARPPYQTVVWFPGNDVFFLRSSETLASRYLFDFIPRSGRALVYPIYQGMYERFSPFDFREIEWRDRMIQWSKDLGRTVDYLETRPDIDSEKIAYYGFSSGANYAPLLTTIDGRFKASIMLSAGLIPDTVRPEMDSPRFAPRSRVPSLMINGVDDFICPYESSQKPLFDLLGTAPSDKRHARLEGGHIPTNRLEIIREVLDWLDRYLGPLQT